MTEQRKNEIFEAASRDVASTSNNIFGFELPAIDVPIPSEGKVYPSTHPLSGRVSATINGMTAAQENILTNKSLAKRGTLLSELIRSCLTNKSINPRDLLIGDRNTLMVAIRISGYGPDYGVKVVCPQCETTSNQKFSLESLPIKNLTIEPIEPGSNLFEHILPQSKARVKFRFLTGADEEDIAITQTQKKRIGVDESSLVTSGLLHSIVSINGITDRSQISMAIPRMPALDSKSLRHYIQDNEPGIQMRAQMTCPEPDCEYVGEVDMPLGANFFWPRSE